MNNEHSAPHDSANTAQQIDVYWRPGCGFCSALRRGLDNAAVEYVEHNIWDDPAAAAIVREHANGNETVPTVVIGKTGMVNPSPKALLGFLAANAPHLLPAEFDAAELAPGKVGRFVGRVLGN